jgi:hypothetical protein
MNGRVCVKRHQGAFYRFKSDVTDLVFFGKKDNLLEVTVSKESANASVNLAERRADYWNFGGIFRPVFIEALPVQFIDRTTMDARADGSFYADVFLGAATEKELTLHTVFSDAQGQVIGRAPVYNLAKGGDRLRVEAQMEKTVQQWTAETPHLYYIDMSLSDGKQVVHRIRERIGFRSIAVKAGDGLYVNGQRIMIRGVNRHSFRPETGRTLSKEDNYADVRLMKAMNMNAVRLSHYPPDPAFLDACDELGLYVMDELGGWHGRYDTTVGTKLVAEMVVRDVNHPSILWWSNGNEGGHNPELDEVFGTFDPQGRPVLHPQKNFGGFETMHYRSYGESLEYLRKPEIFLPTEFLHGLYDGGHGAGLYDYWEMMRRHPRCIGGFLWALADEGVVRTDQGGRIDNVGNYGADGIVGPHHEREGSFYTIKQIWSPVQISTDTFGKSFDGTLTIENRYDFINLRDCRFTYTLRSFAGRQEKTLHSGTLPPIDLAPHTSGTIKLDLPSGWQQADVLYVAAYGPEDEHLWTWDWTGAPFATPAPPLSSSSTKRSISAVQTESQLTVSTGDVSLLFSPQTGRLQEVVRKGRRISLGNGPRFIAARRGDRSMDVYYNHDDKEARSKERIYLNIAGEERLTDFRYQTYADSVVVEATYAGDLTATRWTISADGGICLDYAYYFSGAVELMGIAFDYPESYVHSKQWLGRGPYRVWQNRLHGTEFGIHTVEYNDPVPGETFTYPEFKGYFDGWQWVTFQTTEGEIGLTNAGGASYLGVFTPRDGRDALLYTLPESGIAIFDVIPAVRNKVNATDLVGPSSQAQWVQGPQRGRVFFSFQ